MRLIALTFLAGLVWLSTQAASFADCGPARVVWSQDFECGDYSRCKTSASGWKYELVQPDKQSAKLDVVSGHAHGGTYALYGSLPDRSSGDKSSKATIGIRRDQDGKPFNFKRGCSITVTAWYFLSPHPANAYLLDVESSDNSNHGVRFYVDPSGTVSFNRDKIGLKPHVIVNPSGAQAPLNSWFKFTVVMAIGKGNDGHTKVLINDAVALDYSGANIASFDSYDSIQLGYTVSQKKGELWMDDAEIRYGQPE